jgi:hypothetical protein
VKVVPLCQHRKIDIKHVSGEVAKVTFKTRGNKIILKITVKYCVVEELVFGDR